MKRSFCCCRCCCRSRCCHRDNGRVALASFAAAAPQRPRDRLSNDCLDNSRRRTRSRPIHERRELLRRRERQQREPRRGARPAAVAAAFAAVIAAAPPVLVPLLERGNRRGKGPRPQSGRRPQIKDRRR